MSKSKGDCLQPGRGVTAIYLLPSLLVYLLVFILPVVLIIIMSFFKFSSIKSFTFVGLANYKNLLSDPNVFLALKNNIFLVLVCLVGQLGIAFLLACMLNSKRVKGGGVYRTIIYFPVTLSAVVIGYVWQFIYDYNYGLITYFMNAVGYGDAVTPLLAQVDCVYSYDLAVCRIPSGDYVKCDDGH